MIQASRPFTFLLLTVLLSVVPSSLGKARQQSSKNSFTIVPYYQSRGTCHPAEVKAVVIGASPPEVLSFGVTVESFSAKEITALKLSWKVFSREEGLRRRHGPCEAAADDKVFLSGTTSLIQLGELYDKETCNITSGRPVFVGRATKTVFTDQPIIAWDEVKPLTVDGTRNTFKDDYTAVIYISEIHFADGTIWSGKI
jgi:hypothetical protein